MIVRLGGWAPEEALVEGRAMTEQLGVWSCGDGVLEARGMRSPRVLRLSIVLGLSRGTPRFGVMGPFENARKGSLPPQH